MTDGDDVDFGRCSATLNDGENTIAAKFAATCGEKLSSGAVKENAVLKLTDVAFETDGVERKPFAVINGFEVVDADVKEKVTTPAAKAAKTEPKTPASAERAAVPLAEHVASLFRTFFPAH